MSANIYWRRVAKSNKSFDIGAPSSFLQAMGRAFGDSFPMRLGREHLPTLHGLECASEGMYETYHQIIEAIETNDEIEIWPEY